MTGEASPELRMDSVSPEKYLACARRILALADDRQRSIVQRPTLDGCESRLPLNVGVETDFARNNHRSRQDRATQLTVLEGSGTIAAGDTYS